MISTVTTRPHGIGPSVGLKPTLLSPVQIMEQLNGLSLSGGDIARAADKMLNLAGNGDALSPSRSRRCLCYCRKRRAMGLRWRPD
ncbi:hypothetical protein QNH14_14275 [Apirhabdus apintestini]|nr:hypothetical protein QNH14_14275 [Enterobacteriaceae bacterium CA-0114]